MTIPKEHILENLTQYRISLINKMESLSNELRQARETLKAVEKRINEVKHPKKEEESRDI